MTAMFTTTHFQLQMKLMMMMKMMKLSKRVGPPLLSEIVGIITTVGGKRDKVKARKLQITDDEEEGKGTDGDQTELWESDEEPKSMQASKQNKVCDKSF